MAASNKRSRECTGEITEPSSQRYKAAQLTDEVFYLDGICKDSPIHQRLLESGIYTVQQLLRAHAKDPEKLRSLIENVQASKQGVAEGTWKTIISHAKECIPEDELCCYNVEQVGAVLFFDKRDQILGVYFGDDYCAIESLNDVQKASVENWKELAFLNDDYITLFDPTSSFDKQQDFSTDDELVEEYNALDWYCIGSWSKLLIAVRFVMHNAKHLGVN